MDSENQIYIGRVKWFGDQMRDKQYGFIEIKEFGDVFVHGGETSSELFEDDLVICQVKINDNEEKNHEAKNVVKIDEVQEPQIIIDLLDAETWLDVKQKQLFSRLCELNINDALQNSSILIIQIMKIFIERFNNKSKLNHIEYSNIQSILEDLYRLFNIKSNNSSPNKKYIQILKDMNEHEALYLSCLTFDSFPVPKDILDELFNNSDLTLKKLLLTRVSSEEYERIINNLVEKLNPISKRGDLEFILQLTLNFDGNNSYTPKELLKLIYQSSNDKMRFYLWYKDYWKSFNQELHFFIINSYESLTGEHLSSIFSKLTKTQSLKVIDNIKEPFTISKNKKQQEKQDVILDYVSNLEDAKELYYELLSKLNPERIISLWLEDRIETITLQTITDGLSKLRHKEQEACIQKMIYFVLIDKFSISDIKFKDLIEKNRTKNISFIILIILKILESKLNKSKIYVRSIIGFGIESLSKGVTPNFSSKLLEKCHGRYILRENEIKKVDKVRYNSNNIDSDNIIFCEGRKARDKNTKQPAEEKGHEFYWCKNKPCYKTPIKSDLKKDWKNYTLYELILIIDENFTEDNYTYLLGILNKFREYFAHLRCRRCKNWLYPVKQSNFSFDRVNHFSCQNPNCGSFNSEVYINHCLNSKCDSIIDSRDSKTCPNGWIICSYCFACCSTDKLNLRNTIRKSTGQNVSNKKGHDTLKEIYCFKCGSLMELIVVSIDKEKYDKCINWLEDHKNDSKRVFRSGAIKNKKWYLVRKHDNETEEHFRLLLKKFYDAGLDVSKAEMKDSYFISQPLRDIHAYLKCTNSACNHKLSLNELELKDKSRLHSLKYHVKIHDLYE